MYKSIALRSCLSFCEFLLQRTKQGSRSKIKCIISQEYYVLFKHVHLNCTVMYNKARLYKFNLVTLFIEYLTECRINVEVLLLHTIH